MFIYATVHVNYNIVHVHVHAINRKNNALHCTAMICDMYVLEWNIINLVVLYVFTAVNIVYFEV